MDMDDSIGFKAMSNHGNFSEDNYHNVKCRQDTITTREGTLLRRVPDVCPIGEYICSEIIVRNVDYAYMVFCKHCACIAGNKVLCKLMMANRSLDECFK